MKATLYIILGTTATCVLAGCFLYKTRPVTEYEIKEKQKDTVELILNSYDYIINSGVSKQKEIIQYVIPFDIPTTQLLFSEAGLESYLTDNNMLDKLAELHIYKSTMFDNAKQKDKAYNDSILAICKPCDALDPLYYFLKKPSTNYILLYINNKACMNYGKDVDGIQGCYEKLNYEIKNYAYGVTDSIPDLIFSRNFSYRDNVSSLIPGFLIDLTNQALNDVKKGLPDSLYQKIKHIYLSLEPNQKYLWVRSNEKVIYIAPYLIRAAYIMTLNRFPGYIERFQYSRTDPDEYYLTRTAADLNAVSHVFIDNFKESFYFVFGHELAHIYLGLPTTGAADIEQICDCWAVNFTNKMHTYNTLGLYKDILERSLKSNNDTLWGVKNKAELLSRIEQVKQLKKKTGAGPCLTKPN